MPPRKNDEQVAGVPPPEDPTDDGLGEGRPDAVGWDAGTEHDLAVDRLARMGDELELDTTELVTDVRDFVLDLIKSRPKPWSATSQQEQRDVAAAVEHAAKELVRKVVEAVATNGTASIRVLLTKVSMGGDIVITGKVKTFDEDEEDRAVTTLHRAIGKHVMLTRASADDYVGEGREAATDPDNPEFGFEADDGDGDD